MKIIELLEKSEVEMKKGEWLRKRERPQ